MPGVRFIPAFTTAMCIWLRPASRPSAASCIHLTFPHPEQIKRIAAFKGKVVATVEPGFWQAEAGLERYYGEANKTSYPIKDLFEAGVTTGFSTDFFVSPLELAPPTKIMNIAMAGGGAARRALTMEDILDGFTRGSAATTGKSDVGALYPGMKADMVVYERDLYDVRPSEFAAGNPKVLATWLSGRKAFDAAAAGKLPG